MKPKSDTRCKKIEGYIGLEAEKKLLNFAKMYKLTKSRLVAIAINNELDKETPFKVDFTLPEGIIEFSYAHEAGKIVTYMKGLRNGMSLDLLYVLRHDIGVPDADKFLAGFAECLQKEMLESYVAPANVKYTNSHDTTLYRLKLNNPVVRKKVMKKASKYEQYQKLKKEFGDA